MTARVVAFFKIVRGPVSSSPPRSVPSLMPPTFSRRAHRGKDLRPEGLDPPAADPLHARERLEVAGGSFRDRTHQPIRQGDGRPEPPRGRRPGPPLPRPLETPPPRPPPPRHPRRSPRAR